MNVYECAGNCKHDSRFNTMSKELFKTLCTMLMFRYVNISLQTSSDGLDSHVQYSKTMWPPHLLVFWGWDCKILINFRTENAMSGKTGKEILSLFCLVLYGRKVQLLLSLSLAAI